ncbi:MAG: M48 family metalloprotease [Hormoscilla sp. GM7CHS1pb]|nr:M48 family metalloprotease [Hormoscilla sp. GM7CHS1pb]
MKLKSLWKLLTGAMAIGFAIVLVWAPTTESKIPPALRENPTASPPVAKAVEIAQIFGRTRYQKLAEADRFIKLGNLGEAERLQRQVKPAFAAASPPPKPVLEIEDVSPAARVYWREANAGLQQGLESKTFVPLELLTENYPDFIPGHLLLASAAQKYGQPERAIAALERATSLYPSNTELLDRKIALLAEQDQWLEAAIAARQFALTYPKNPQAAKYDRLADKHFQKYRSQIEQDLFGLGIGNVVACEVIEELRRRQELEERQDECSGAELIMLLLQGEAATGKAFAESLKKDLTLVEDPAVVEYVNEIGQKLARFMGRDEFEYEFYVVEDSTPNAFALPGGKIFIHSGLMKLMGSEAELAGLLAHEIGHAVLSHGFLKISQKAVVDTINEVIPFGEIITQLTSLENSRNLERQADILGTRAIAAAGYAADGLHSVMQLLKQLQRNAPPEWLSTHPAPRSRVRYLEELIQRNGYNRYAYEGVESYQRVMRAPEPTRTQPASTPRRNQPRSGPVALNIVQRKGDVQISINRANVNATGGFTVDLVIKNDSNDKFGFVPLFVQVLDDSGNRVSSRFLLTAGEDAFVPPGGSLRRTLLIVGARWQTGSQDLTVVVKESTPGGRVFRIPL